MTARRASGLVVPVEAARELVAPWLDLIPATSRALPPHVTVLWPFLPLEALDASVERELEGLLAGAGAFAFSLARVTELADVTCLAPEPAEPFAALTRLLWAHWPECPPYGGAYEDVIPHLAVAVDPAAADRRGIEESLAPLLPLAAVASEALLVAEDVDGVLRERRRFPLGG